MPETPSEFAFEFTDRENKNSEIFKLPAWRPSFRSGSKLDGVSAVLFAVAALIIAYGIFQGSSNEWSTVSAWIYIFVGVATAIATPFLRTTFVPYFTYDIPALNNPPEEEEPVPVENEEDKRQGTVHRGRTEVPLNGDDNTRPYIWLWFDAAEGNDCGRMGNYRWYQFVNLHFYIDDRKKKVTTPIEGATGLDYHFDKWNPDYHPGELPPDAPDFSPPKLGPKSPGKPFRDYDIPGTQTGGGTSRLTGVLDSPNFCNRGDQQQAPIERLVGRFIPDEAKVIEQPDQPGGRQTTAKVKIEARSYLVCVRGEQVECIGYVSWTYTIEADIRLVYRNVGVAGGLTKRWELGSEILNCELDLDIGNWTMPC
ncbi:hypothetical protein NC796_06670 [Aliifodinibius sp. S!AR15-10]|uniref:hypothetical protein n=1 Tax=Aliifodinibius sp. S!AR15-10 TaxID=2950437 RepID=UPI002858DD9F|nr:hypothetical protein [Aliifodinibius sp. S!AR15-10]MDR8390812.1 hypothetical protein [Aliifodinibius sp. S!AR15-10]